MFENDAHLRRRPSQRYVNSAGQWIRLDRLPRSTQTFFSKGRGVWLDEPQRPPRCEADRLRGTSPHTWIAEALGNKTFAGKAVFTQGCRRVAAKSKGRPLASNGNIIRAQKSGEFARLTHDHLILPGPVLRFAPEGLTSIRARSCPIRTYDKGLPILVGYRRGPFPRRDAGRLARNGARRRATGRQIDDGKLVHVHDRHAARPVLHGAQCVDRKVELFRTRSRPRPEIGRPVSDDDRRRTIRGKSHAGGRNEPGRRDQFGNSMIADVSAKAEDQTHEYEQGKNRRGGDSATQALPPGLEAIEDITSEIPQTCATILWLSRRRAERTSRIVASSCWVKSAATSRS